MRDFWDTKCSTCEDRLVTIARLQEQIREQKATIAMYRVDVYRLRQEIQDHKFIEVLPGTNGVIRK